jgi:membrane protease YdiL (CAAX protease family)
MASEYQTDAFVPDPSGGARSSDPTWEEASLTPALPVSAPRPWGPWATIGWTALLVAVMFAVQIAVLIGFVVVRRASHPAARIDDLPMNGNLLATAALLSVPALIGLVALLIAYRRYPIRDYLALTWPPAGWVFAAVAGLVLLLGASDLISTWLGHPVTSPVMMDVYRTAWLPLLLLALLVAAPLGEETLFRGFLFKGLAVSPPGPVVAVLVSSAAWALLHVQYDWHEIVTIATMGFYLGFVRYRTGSVLVTMLLHCVANAYATAQLVLKDQGLS